MTKATATYSPDSNAGAGKRVARPIPRKAKRTAIIFSVVLGVVAVLPALLEATGTRVNIGPWLSLLITLPMTLLAMAMMGFLRDGLTANLISAAAILFGLTVGYATTFEPADFDSGRSTLIRTAAPVICAVILGFFWLSLRTHLRDLHYWVDQGQSLQDIMMRYQQANVIRKAGGKPALMEDGKVVDANEVQPRKGFRQKPQKSAKQQGERKKRKKPKVR
jgi:hypothetical protein